MTSLCDRILLNSGTPKILVGNAGNLLDKRFDIMDTAGEVPTLVEELNTDRSDKFLQCSSTCEPATSPEIWILGFDVVSSSNIWEAYVEDVGFLISRVHEIDRFRQFRAARFVDSTSIDPNQLSSVY